MGGDNGAQGGLSGEEAAPPNVCYYPGVVWTSRLGHTYLVHPPPITEPLPDPITRTEPAPPLLVSFDADLAIWEDNPPERNTEPPAQPSLPPDLSDYLPPF
jgi:hypothetical protein